MASLRRRKKAIPARSRSTRTGGRVDDGPVPEERSPFGWALEERWEEAWRQARREDLR